MLQCVYNSIMEAWKDMFVYFSALILKEQQLLVWLLLICNHIDQILFTTESGDYTPLTASEVTFIPGQSSVHDRVQCFNISITDDDILEDHETFSVFLTAVDRLYPLILTPGNTTADVVIKEDVSDGMSSAKLMLNDVLLFMTIVPYRF